MALVLFFSTRAMHDASLLAQQPNPILDQIVGYIEFANLRYETDYFFIKRLRQFPPGRQKKAAGNGNQTFTINEQGSLALIEEKIEGKSVKKVIRANADFHFLKRAYRWYALASDPDKNKVKFFALSANRLAIACLVDFDRIISYNLSAVQENEMIVRPEQQFNLGPYYKKEGSVIARAVSQRLERVARGYLSLSQKDPFIRPYSSISWCNPVRLIAVSSQGSIAFANDHQLFLVEKKEGKLGYRLLHEDPLKKLAPNIAWDLGNMSAIAFNRQGTKLAMIYHKAHAYLDDLPIAEDHDCLRQENIRLAMMHRFLQEDEEIKNFRQIKKDELDQAKTVEELMQKLNHLSEGVVNRLRKKVAKELASIDSIDDSNQIRIIPLQEDCFTLARCLALKGVCKNIASSRH